MLGLAYKVVSGVHIFRVCMSSDEDSSYEASGCSSGLTADGEASQVVQHLLEAGLHISASLEDFFIGAL